MCISFNYPARGNMLSVFGLVTQYGVVIYFLKMALLILKAQVCKGMCAFAVNAYTNINIFMSAGIIWNVGEISNVYYLYSDSKQS